MLQFSRYVIYSRVPGQSFYAILKIHRIAITVDVQLSLAVSGLFYLLNIDSNHASLSYCTYKSRKNTVLHSRTVHTKQEKTLCFTLVLYIQNKKKHCASLSYCTYKARKNTDAIS